MKTNILRELLLMVSALTFVLCSEAQIKEVYKIVIDNSVYNPVYDSNGRLLEMNCNPGVGTPSYKFSYQGNNVIATRWNYVSILGGHKWNPIYAVKSTNPTSSNTKIIGAVYNEGDINGDIMSNFTLTKENYNSEYNLPGLDIKISNTHVWKNNSLQRIIDVNYPKGDADVIFEYGNVSYNSQKYSLDWLCFAIDRMCFNEDVELLNYWQNTAFPPFSLLPSKITDRNRKGIYNIEYQFDDDLCTIKAEEINDNVKTQHTIMVFFK
jgi:hypothetical protein